MKRDAALDVTFITGLSCLGVSVARAQGDYTLFESDPVTPMAISPDGSRLLVVNAPDGYLEVFDFSSGAS